MCRSPLGSPLFLSNLESVAPAAEHNTDDPIRPPAISERDEAEKTAHGAVHEPAGMAFLEVENHEGAKEIVLGRLTALEVARKLEREKRKEKTTELTDPRESIQSFLAEFGAQQQNLSRSLEELLATGMHVDRDLKLLQEQLDRITAQAFQMEKNTANASYFLPSYDLKQCTAAVADLKQRTEAARAELLPKRKFAFSKKVSRVKGAEMSSAAAEANPLGAVPVSAGGTSVVAASSSREAAAQGEEAPSVPQPACPSQQDIALVQAGQGFMGLRNKVVILTPDEVCGRDFVLIDLEGCQVYLLGHMPALRMMGLRDTTVVAGPVTGACFVDDATGCVIILASYQVRIHSSTDTDFYLRARSKPIIEHSRRVRFAPFSLGRQGGTGQPAGDSGSSQQEVADDSTISSLEDQIQALLLQHKLGEETGMYQQVEDFGWIKSSHSPNWCILPEAERMAPLMVPWGSQGSS